MPLIQNVGRKIGDKTIARKIIYPKGWDEAGKPLADAKGKPINEEILMPGKHRKVTDAQFKHLKEIFGAEIVNVDNIRELQDKVAADGAQERPERPQGYVAPDEVDALVEKRTAEKLAAIKRDGGEAQDSDRGALANKIDAMDRSELIALIEKENLEIEHKSVRIDTLKASILEALTADKEAA